jgi:ABC-type bacteriocin/lantibiotic exporter with double-glycine peptidase domain
VTLNQFKISYIIRKLYDILSVQERRKAVLVCSMIITMVFLDLISVSIVPLFIAVLSTPNLLNTNSILNSIYTKLDFHDSKSFLLFLGLMVFLMMLFSIAFKALVTHVQMRFIMMREYSIGKRLIETYLQQPYSWFLNRHSASLGNKILGEINTVIFNSLIPIMNVFAQMILVVALLSLLIFVDPLPALSVGGTLVAAYAIIFKLLKSKLATIGESRYKTNLERWSSVHEAFSAFKELKLAGLENTYVRRFALPAETYAKNLADSISIGQLPRYAMEAVVYGGMLLIVILSTFNRGSITDALPIISLYAFTGYRLMPALQNIYSSVTQLSIALPALDSLHHDLMDFKFSQIQSAPVQLTFENGIWLNDIRYTYPNAKRQTLKGISIAIPARSSVGLVGSTGSGKTTLVDIVLGLLEPQGGTLQVDSTIIDVGNLRSWQEMIGYVPQQIYLSDDSVAANIAFGVDKDNIDWVSVERASKIAELHDFVVNDLPQGYLTTVGERGVRLSGGQRQRIGIARALYHNPKVLILDEATSALDNLTEQAVMDSMENLGNSITTILIAHRLSTVRKCDIIYLMEEGEIKSHGTYQEMQSSNLLFQRMTGVTD